MDPAEFNNLYLQNLLATLTFENKDTLLMGDFNINILQYDNNKDSQEFLDKMQSNFLLTYIFSPSRVTPYSQTLGESSLRRCDKNQIPVQTPLGTQLGP